MASAGWAPAGPVLGGYKGPQHVPVIHDGVPVETPEVQHAKAAHFSALAEAASRPGYQALEPSPHEEYSGNQHGGGHAGYSFHSQHNPAPVHHAPAPVHYAPAPVHHAPAPVHHAPVNYAPKAHIHPAYETSNVLPAIAHDGSPLDTPEVEQAKHHHFAEFSKALAATAPHQPEEPQQHYHSQPAHHYRRRRGLYSAHIPVINHHGVPVEPVEVQHARAAHLAAYHAPAHGYSTHQVHAPVYGHHYEHWIPKYDHHGRPLDTAEVEHAKQAHFHAFHEAAARNSVHGYAGGWSHGVPHDTPEVAHAKAAHFAAHAAAKGHHY